MTHFLKTWTDPFTAIHDGVKRHEYRIDDRVYVEGDTLILQEFEHCQKCNAKGMLTNAFGGIECCPACLGEKGIFTGRELSCESTYISRYPSFGVPEGYVVMSIRLPGDVFEKRHTPIE